MEAFPMWNLTTACTFIQTNNSWVPMKLFISFLLAAFVGVSGTVVEAPVCTDAEALDFELQDHDAGVCPPREVRRDMEEVSISC